MNGEKEYAYEFGLTADDRARIQQHLGIHTLSLEDYENAKNVVNDLEQHDG